uniref:Uncharacterized protein n=1 Tax=viral metagenome TaxID=1070528 RepID=A0A6M3KQE8_9ZZZZ
MLLKFKLSMPNNNSWNGKWSGDGKEYNIMRNFTSKKEAQRMLDKGYYHYNFGDGWSAGIDVTKLDAKQARQARKASKGFCGYEWMVDSIWLNDEIKVRG